MKYITSIFIVTLLAGCAHQPVEETPKPGITPAEFDHITTPGQMQQLLTAYVGKWQEVHTFWQDEHSKGDTDSLTVESALIMGGRYLQIRETGVLAGEPFEGIGMLGYDNLKDVL